MIGQVKGAHVSASGRTFDSLRQTYRTTPSVHLAVNTIGYHTGSETLTPSEARGLAALLERAATEAEHLAAAAAGADGRAAVPGGQTRPGPVDRAREDA